MSDPREEISAEACRELLAAALELADLCAETTASIVATGFQISKKADESLVTTADVETEKAFRERVGERFPEMGVLGEELGESGAGADFRWVIDPVDGTAEFARHVPLYGCIIGLHYKVDSETDKSPFAPSPTESVSASTGPGPCHRSAG